MTLKYLIKWDTYAVELGVGKKIILKIRKNTAKMYVKDSKIRMYQESKFLFFKKHTGTIRWYIMGMVSVR